MARRAGKTYLRSLMQKHRASVMRLLREKAGEAFAPLTVSGALLDSSKGAVGLIGVPGHVRKFGHTRHAR
jgi:hypothetical protein